MGQLIIPTNNKINGPWLLEKSNLEELSNTLELIENKINDAYEILAIKTAESKFEEYKARDESINLEDVIKKIKQSYIFADSEKYMEFISKEGKKITDSTLINLLKDPNIKDFKPSEIKLKIKKGPCEFSLDITTKYDGEAQIRVKIPEDEILNDVNYEINKWIDKHKPNIALQKWSSWFPSSAFLILFLLLLMTRFLVKTKEDLFHDKLNDRAVKLLETGISTDEQKEAIEILIQEKFKYVPKDFNPNLEINSTMGTIWIITLIGLVILIIKPKTTIGIGKNTWKVKFYKKWIYIVFIFIPLSIILPLIRNQII